MPQPRFPNLFVIGAMKAGTSSLHEYLHQHPEIFMSRFKEPQYFAPHTTRWGDRWGQGEPRPEPGIDWYLRLFADAGDVKYAGESSVSYAARPWVVDCERRIHDFNPDARIVYLLRDPVERALSHYWHFVADGREDLDMLTALRRRPEYVARSSYAMQLEPYLDAFGRHQVHVMTIEELNANPGETFARLFDWLGVAADVSIDIATSYNVGSPALLQTRRGLVFLDTLQKHWKWKRVRRRLPGFVARALPPLTYRSIWKADVDERPAVEYLRPILQAETRRLSTLVGREFPDWKSVSNAAASQTRQLRPAVTRS